MNKEELKKILKISLISTLLIFIAYGILSFVLYDINTSNWGIEYRGLLGVVSLFIIFATSLFTMNEI